MVFRILIPVLASYSADDVTAAAAFGLTPVLPRWPLRMPSYLCSAHQLSPVGNISWNRRVCEVQKVTRKVAKSCLSCYCCPHYSPKVFACGGNVRHGKGYPPAQLCESNRQADRKILLFLLVSTPVNIPHTLLFSCKTWLAPTISTWWRASPPITWQHVVSTLKSNLIIPVCAN